MNAVHQRDFSVILRNDLNSKNFKSISPQFSNANSMKPLVYFSSAFGMQIIQYSSNDISKVKMFRKLYCACVVLTIISVYVFLRPVAWKYTLQDIPLNVLTKGYTLLSIFDGLYASIIMTFSKSQNYIELFKLLDDLDYHFGTFKTMSKKRFLLSIFFVILPTIQVSFTFWLRKFDIFNIGPHLIFFLLMLQGAIIMFFAFNIFLKYLMFRYLLTKKTDMTISEHKSIFFEDSIFRRIIKVSFNFYFYFLCVLRSKYVRNLKGLL